MLVEEIKNCKMNNILFLENPLNVGYGGEEEYLDNKELVCKTSTSDNKLKECLKIDIKNQYKISITEHNIKTEALYSEVPDNKISDNIKIEEQIWAAQDIKIEYDDELLFCASCQAYYEDYCFTCGMLVHILNKNGQSNIDLTVSEEIPTNILEMDDSHGHLGIFALKIIPEGVKFGPFTGLSGTECPWKMKQGKFLVDKYQSTFLNWMQYINLARNVSEQNLLPFQCEGNLYYRSTRQIQNGEELLVYLGETCEETEMDFIPTTEDDAREVFACTFCCLGFSSRLHLVKHKSICHHETNKKFSIDELTHCPSCKIYLWKEEYYDYHITYCNEGNIRQCNPLAPEDNNQVAGAKQTQLQIYNCTQCEYETNYEEDLEDHSDKHHEVNSYNCEICSERFGTKKAFNMHVESVHIDQISCRIGSIDSNALGNPSKVDRCSQHEIKRAVCKSGSGVKAFINEHIQLIHLEELHYKCAACEFKTKWKSDIRKHIKTQHLEKCSYTCELCDFRTERKPALETHIRTKHLKKFDYACEMCDFKSNHKASLEDHTKTMHLKEYRFECTQCEFKAYYRRQLKMHTHKVHLKEASYECAHCEYKTNWKPYLDTHTKRRHLTGFRYECPSCEYKSNVKSYVAKHVRVKHLEEFNYKCERCNYKTDRKLVIERHMKTKHLKEFDYSCDTCDYRTNGKENLEIHIKTKHLKEFDYKCDACDYKTNVKSELEKHTKTKHLKEFNFKCSKCEYKTNYKSHLGKHIITQHHK